ncbi:hypothetical protein DSO57_1032005 [Entomophthora muscae]|uniref:Uncharacterized protein n=1 Tax=Entomophthora muscae TaxID=34485 RepID=A0ACC2TME6_9FUNG|nr:hypothetical protein DSO57_1032005 [Entomophthora muscae]
MGKKRKVIVTILPWCWYCEREFDSEKLLIEHQRKRHYTCEICSKKHKTLAYLNEHSIREHKAPIEKVAYSLPGRDSVDIVIRGTEGIPEKDVLIHSKKIEAQFEDEQSFKRKLPSGDRPSPEASPDRGSNVSSNLTPGFPPAPLAQPIMYSQDGRHMPPPMPHGYPPMIYQAHALGPYGPGIFGPLPHLPFGHMPPPGFPPLPPYPLPPRMHPKVPGVDQFHPLRFNNPLRPEPPQRFATNGALRPQSDSRHHSGSSESKASFDDSPHNSSSATRPFQPQSRGSPPPIDSHKSSFHRSDSRDSRDFRHSRDSRDSRDFRRPRNDSMNKGSGLNPHSHPQPRPEPVEKPSPPRPTHVFKHPVNNLFSPHAFSPKRQADHKMPKSKLGNSYESESSRFTEGQHDSHSWKSRNSDHFASPPSPSKLKFNSSLKREGSSRRISDNNIVGTAFDAPIYEKLAPDYILDEPQPFDEFSIQPNENIVCIEHELSLEELRASDERYACRPETILKQVAALNSGVDKHIALIRQRSR